MNELINVDPEEFRQAASRLDTALESFKAVASSFSQESYDRLEGFNSDFIYQLKLVIKHIGQESGPSLFSAIREYQEGIALLADVFESADSSIADEL
ncbi:MAG: hypothetical protein FWH40_05650 [Coriobacteriia bacterium]|nr:hypothetical protein [Coriobacteriia bacterium]